VTSKSAPHEAEKRAAETSKGRQQMTLFDPRKSLSMDRRTVLGYGAAAGLAASPLGRYALAQTPSVDVSQWSPEYIQSIAGTIDVDTAAECAKVVPLDYEGHVTLWYVGANEASDPITHEMERQFFEAFAKTYPNITIDKLNLNYNDISTKLRTAALGRAAPMVARLMLLWGGEYAAKGQLMELAPEDVGHDTSDFWPGAMKSCRWQGNTYGVPCRNETMALIWNAQIFDEAGLPPESQPETWADVVAYSKQIKETTGKAGYGLVARVNAGNTPYRFMPMAWAYGGGALDEIEPDPRYQSVYIHTEGTQAALQDCYDMYVRDRSVPVSALTNTNNENMDPFTASNLAMMISHPSSYTALIARAEGT
jgi:multiple sugar transport system substrate-binding protein